MNRPIYDKRGWVMERVHGRKVGNRRMSDEARENMAKAARARWSRLRKEKKA